MRIILSVSLFLARLFASSHAFLDSECTTEPVCGGFPPFLNFRPMCCNGVTECVWLTTIAVWFDCTCGSCNVTSTSGNCCKYNGWIPEDCQNIEVSFGPSDAVDEVCNDVNSGSSCYWDYSDPDCCRKAVDDGVGTVNSCDPDGSNGECCAQTGPIPFNCQGLESLPGADIDQRCQQVNGGLSCTWNYNIADCCNIAINDGYNSAGVTC